MIHDTLCIIGDDLRYLLHATTRYKVLKYKKHTIF